MQWIQYGIHFFGAVFYVSQTHAELSRHNKSAPMPASWPAVEATSTLLIFLSSPDSQRCRRQQPSTEVSSRSFHFLTSVKDKNPNLLTTHTPTRCIPGSVSQYFANDPHLFPFFNSLWSVLSYFVGIYLRRADTTRFSIFKCGNMLSFVLNRFRPWGV